jgi:hypothetical protein
LQLHFAQEDAGYFSLVDDDDDDAPAVDATDARRHVI